MAKLLIRACFRILNIQDSGVKKQTVRMAVCFLLVGGIISAKALIMPPIDL